MASENARSWKREIARVTMHGEPLVLGSIDARVDDSESSSDEENEIVEIGEEYGSGNEKLRAVETGQTARISSEMTRNEASIAKPDATLETKRENANNTTSMRDAQSFAVLGSLSSSECVDDEFSFDPAEIPKSVDEVSIITAGAATLR